MINLVDSSIIFDVISNNGHNQDLLSNLDFLAALNVFLSIFFCFLFFTDMINNLSVKNFDKIKIMRFVISCILFLVSGHNLAFTYGYSDLF